MEQKVQIIKATCAKIMEYVIEQNKSSKVVTRTELNERLEVKKNDPRGHTIVSDAILNLVENQYLHRQFLSDEGIVNFWVTARVDGKVNSLIELEPDNFMLDADARRSPHPDLWIEGYRAYTQATHVLAIENAAKAKPTWPWTPRPAYIPDPNEVVHTDLTPCAIGPDEEIMVPCGVVAKELDTSAVKVISELESQPVAPPSVGSIIDEKPSNVTQLFKSGRIWRKLDYSQLVIDEKVRHGFGKETMHTKSPYELLQEKLKGLACAFRARARQDAVLDLLEERPQWRLCEHISHMASLEKPYQVYRALEQLQERAQIEILVKDGFTYARSLRKQQARDVLTPQLQVVNATQPQTETTTLQSDIAPVMTKVAEFKHPIYVEAVAKKQNENTTVTGTPLERNGASTIPYPSHVSRPPIVVTDVHKGPQVPMGAGGYPLTFSEPKVTAQATDDPQGILGLYSKLGQAEKGLIVSLLLRLQA